MTIAEKNLITNSYMQNIAVSIPNRVKNRYQAEFELILDNTLQDLR